VIDMTTKKREKLETITDEVGQFHPLLAKLLPKLPNVIEVEYTHGNREMGADFVLSVRHETLKHTDYVGVIAKVGNITQDFTDVEKQIDECTVERFFWGGTKQVRINEIWVALTGHITKAAQEKIHEKYKSRKIVFLSGRRLETLIDELLPSFWFDLSLETGEYLNSVRQRNEDIDRSVSLLQIGDKRIYIEQDVFESPEFDVSQKAKRRAPARKVDINSEILHHKILLIEGGMGSGKSKLLRRVVDDYTDLSRHLESNLLPVPISYRDFIDQYDGDIERLLDARVGKKLRDELGGDTRFLLLIDGVDEKNLPVSEQVEKLIDLVSKINQRTDVKAIITSRYLKAVEQIKELENHVKKYDLRPLSLNKTIEFITKLSTSLNLKNRIIQDLKKSQLFHQLPRSPIAAILLAKLLHENAQDLPSNMTELYSKVLELMLGRWDIDKGLQSQKEYQALDNIMMSLARWMVENELPQISITEAEGFFDSYLKDRNLGIDRESLFQKMVERCEIIMVDEQSNTFGFKHRSFAEFFNAKALLRDGSLQIDERVFHWYWMNTFFFYLGLVKDCPTVIEEIVAITPSEEVGKWIKAVNMSNYFLAAYTTPYEAIAKGIFTVFVEAAELYMGIVNKKADSMFSLLPRMQLLYIVQWLMQDSYSFEFFKGAIEQAALLIDESDLPDEIKAYALLFLNGAYMSIGPDRSFDFLLKNYKPDLPLDVSLLVIEEGKRTKELSVLVKRQHKHLKRILKNNRGLERKIKDFYDNPISSRKKKLLTN
jgi:hypothetical protein